MARRSKPRRGVLLLIVLSLLVLFLLIGLSFMVSASQFNRLAKSAARTDVAGMPGSKLADAALYQILRGTLNPYSAIQGHSLLEDLYGRDYLVIQTESNVQSHRDSADQIQRIRFELDEGSFRLGQPLPEEVDDPQELRDDYYAGCVLTFLNGTAKGISTRVLAYKPQSPTGSFLLIKGVSIDGVRPTTGGGNPLRFIINGKPFNGTGAGYNWLSGGLDNKVDDAGGLPLAFLPNYRSYRDIADGTMRPYLSGEASYNYGGLDESWDSVDYQNFFLAKSVDLAKMQSVATALAELDDSKSVSADATKLLTYLEKTGGSTPSFHRPYLVEHLNQRLPDAVFGRFKRAIIARPTQDDHPGFTGSNPAFDPVFGPWDVDCNGDGIPDSVWIDAGLSPVSGKDGRLYKPLIAAHIVDMDGRLNINSIESLERSKARATKSLTNFQSINGVIPVGGTTLPIEAGDNAAFGLGYGPADISSSLAGVRAPNLLRSRYAGRRRDGRNRPAERALAYSALSSLPAQLKEKSTPGVGPADRAFSDDGTNPEFQRDTRPIPRIPDWFGGRLPELDQDLSSPGIQTSLETGYGSPTDYHARALPYLDAQGNLIWGGRSMGQFDNVDDPYEINLLKFDTHDDPFDLSDLEAIHRVDVAHNQSRAVELLVAGATTTTMDQYTTHSFSIPVPPAIGSGYHRGLAPDPVNNLPGDGLKRSLREVFAARIRRVHATTGSRTPIPSTVALGKARRIMAPELLRGEKLDINRVLIPNHPDHTNAQRLLLLGQKERFARQLFNLLMLISDQGEAGSFGLPVSGASAQQQQMLHARRLAQWAINVVDFGDADSVMTMLRYDVNPFNELEPFDAQGKVRDGDSVDPVHLNDLAVVWGMEHPELVLTETLAFHDRRAADSDEGMTLADGDEDLDSTMKPEGSVFFELYCPRVKRPVSSFWSNIGSRAPEDMYRTQDVLDLGVRNGAKPVWRLAVAAASEGNDSPNALVDSNRTQLSSFELSDLGMELVRFIWFCNTPPRKVDNEEDSENTYFNRYGNRAHVSPGGYFVIGPREDTRVGLTKDGSPSPQRVSLNAGAPLGSPGSPWFPGISGGGFHFRVLGETTRDRRPSQTAAIIAESATGVGCSVSEPLGGYDADSSETPLDSDSESPIADRQNTGTYEDFRSVFLQRLADPTRPWDATSNPYRTVDWMPVDLTVFNSLYDGLDDPDDENPKNPLNDFASREKAGVRSGNPLNLLEDRFNIWSAWTQFAPRIATPRKHPTEDRMPGEAVLVSEDAALHASLTKSVNTNVVHSLGWLNRSFDFVNAVGDGLDHYRPEGEQYDEAPQNTIDPVTGLVTTFPTLVWNNRPYANPYELMLVPASASSTLSTEFTVSQPPNPYKAANPILDSFSYRGPFGHLLNFFHSSNGTKNEVTAELGGNYFRLFDFVTVPSPFKGTKTWYRTNRNLWSELLWNDSTIGADSVLGLATNPAALTKFREPGKVNLNTAPDSVWNNVGFDSLLKSWRTPDGVFRRSEEFELSMAGGYKRISAETSSTDVTGRIPNGAYPAEFPNPLRSGMGADLIARLSAVPTSAADATMLRGAVDRQPILGRYALPPPNPSVPGQVEAYTLQNRRTNPYFRFKDLMKLGNSVTSQSNVYAIWITIGYFEVEPNVNPMSGETFFVDGAHPDGLSFRHRNG